jgi:hypothetical protein
MISKKSQKNRKKSQNMPIAVAEDGFYPVLVGRVGVSKLLIFKGGMLCHSMLANCIKFNGLSSLG